MWEACCLRWTYAGAQGGEVVVTSPPDTPCYLCATVTRHTIEESSNRVETDVDYGTGRLVGQVALGADVHHVASAAVKIVLSLLTPRDSEVSLGGFAAHHFLAVRRGIYMAVLAGLVALFAHINLQYFYAGGLQRKQPAAAQLPQRPPGRRHGPTGARRRTTGAG